MLKERGPVNRQYLRVSYDKLWFQDRRPNPGPFGRMHSFGTTKSKKLRTAYTCSALSTLSCTLAFALRPRHGLAGCPASRMLSLYCCLADDR
eukprot:4739657-Amphidinium_carterae.1